MNVAKVSIKELGGDIADTCPYDRDQGDRTGECVTVEVREKTRLSCAR